LKQRTWVNKKNKLNSFTKIRLLGLSHYKFKMRIKSLLKTKIVDCQEDYTSKTCTNCGWLNDKLRNKDIFDCLSCHLKIDRDMNGARNILIKNNKLVNSGWS